MRGFKTFGALALAAGTLFAVSTTASDSSADGDKYTVSYSAESCSAGAECKVHVKINVTAADYHVNPEYNHKIIASGDGVTFKGGGADGKVFSKKDGHLKINGEKSSDMTITFVPSKKGKVTISGEYKLAVCTESNCNPGKTSISTSVDVK